MKKIIFSLIIIFIGLFLYGHYIEVNNIKINEFALAGNVPESFKELKIVQFSDLLYTSEYKNNLKKLSETINNEEPDIIIFSGDLLKKNIKYTEEEYQTIEDFLKNLQATLYKIAVVGDNDLNNIDKYKDMLYASDFKLLDNENMLFFHKDNTPINIIGIKDTSNIDELLKPEVETNYTIVITHEPDTALELSNYPINTIISGHSLGGVINVPFVGGIIKQDGAKTYLNSYYKINNTELYISNGLGYNKFNYRLFNTPSINVYRFTSE